MTADQRPGTEVELSVVVPVLNAEHTIAEQLDALSAQPDPGVSWEVLVVDNGCTDGTLTIVDTYIARHPSWRLVHATREHNLAYVRNVGVDACIGKSIVFADADDVVGENWLPAMAHALREHPLVACAMEYERLNDSGTMSGRSRFQSAHLGEMLDRPVANGAIGVHRWVWDAVSGNDERWSFTGEDFDFALRVARDLHVEPYFAADAVYHYRHRSSPREAFRQARRYGESHVALYARHRSWTRAQPERFSSALRSWAWVITRAPSAAVGDATRQDWARLAGKRLGRLIGSVKNRTRYL
jgi:glycosyltransferase involved in cell wall biosynthesis